MVNQEGLRVPGNELEIFLDRPLRIVVADLAESWYLQDDITVRGQAQQGRGRVFALEREGFHQFFKLQEAVVYDDEITKLRFPKSRAPIISSSRRGEVIGFTYHTYILPFLTVGGPNDSSNIQLANFIEVDRFGDAIPQRKPVRGGKFSPLVGLKENYSRAQLTPFNFRGDLAFLVSTKLRQYTPEELKALEDFILNGED